ncbi:ABC transporter substrate-binding protein [Carnobacteriaceae bacterium zg-ZUI78]|nr:ABC transporter substrate-binding protein [Granulicatella sp. zg-84]MBS4749616.1 ABC transporter substrate-binding protein [Carnobacteriaceae bacterium zg-ZUI78]
MTKLLCACMVFILCACQQQKVEETKKEEALEKVTIVLDWTPNTNHTGIYVAKEKGYFKDAGLDVDIVQPGEDGAEITVASNKAAFGIGFQDSLIGSLVEGLPIKAIAAIVSHNTSGILSLKETGIDSPKKLEGKRYATWGLPLEQAMMKHIVEKDGGDSSKVNMIPTTVTDIVSALKTNIDAVWVFEGWDSIAAKQHGVDTNYLAFNQLNPVFDYYTPVLISNDETIKNKADMVKRFVQALSKGYTYSAEHPDDAATILLKAAPELDEKLVKESQKFLSTKYIDNGHKWGYIDSKRWNAFYQWVNEQKLLEKTLENNTGFTNAFIEN